jgi:hypothetical protein
MGRPFCTEGVEAFKGLAQYLPVKEEDGVAGLILRAGGHVVAAGQFASVNRRQPFRFRASWNFVYSTASSRLGSQAAVAEREPC